jgi:hypothetical protein
MLRVRHLTSHCRTFTVTWPLTWAEFVGHVCQRFANGKELQLQAEYINELREKEAMANDGDLEQFCRAALRERLSLTCKFKRPAAAPDGGGVHLSQRHVLEFGKKQVSLAVAANSMYMTDFRS